MITRCNPYHAADWIIWQWGAPAAGWRLWLLSPEQPTPLAIDASEEVVGAPPPPLPFPTLNGSDLVWSTVHRVAGRLRYELLDHSIVTGNRRVLASASVTATEYWFPSLAADGALVYGTVEHQAAGLAFHVSLTNLAGARPTRLDPSGEVAAPAFNGSVVLWKRITQNVFEAGNLELYDLATRSVTPIWFGRQAGGVNYPSVGNRYGRSGATTTRTSRSSILLAPSRSSSSGGAKPTLRHRTPANRRGSNDLSRWSL
jgi:hypothetical protein